MKDCLNSQKNLIGYTKMNGNNILVVDWEEDQAGFVVNNLRFMNSAEAINYEIEGSYGEVSYFRCLIPNDEFLGFVNLLHYYEYYSVFYKLIFHSYYDDDSEMIFCDEFHPVMLGLECIRR